MGRNSHKSNHQIYLYLKSGVKSIEELYKKVHEAIRKDCDRKKRGPKKDPKRDHTKYK